MIDTGSASFGVAVCVWAAGVAIGRGGLCDDIRRRIDNLVPRIGTAFMVGVPRLTDRGGRAATVELDGDGVPVLAMSNGELEILDRVTTIEDTIDVMSTYAAGWTASGSSVGSSAASANASNTGVTVAIGTSDESSRPLAERLEQALSGIEGIDGDRALPDRAQRRRPHRPGNVRSVRLSHDPLSREWVAGPISPTGTSQFDDHKGLVIRLTRAP